MAGQSVECQAQYLVMVERLEEDGYLIEPFARKIDRDLFELRVRRGRASAGPLLLRRCRPCRRPAWLREEDAEDAFARIEAGKASAESNQE